MKKDIQACAGRKSGAATGQIATFLVGDLYCGIDVMRVQEVLRFQPITRVPLASSVIEGLINLRGQIVTAIDLRRKLGLAPVAAGHCPMNIVVRSQDGPVSLLVDEIGDVLIVDPQCWEKVPATLTREHAELLEGVYKLDSRLLLLINTERILSEASSTLAEACDLSVRADEN